MDDARPGNSGMHEHLKGVRNSRQLPEGRTPDDTVFIDGTDAVLGRVASFAAKNAINGKKVVVVNCNGIIITGKKQLILDDYKNTMAKVQGRHKGPFYSRKSENLVRDTIAGMLPRTDRGRKILKNVEVYRDIPKEYAGRKILSQENLKKSGNVTKFITIRELSRQISRT